MTQYANFIQNQSQDDSKGILAQHTLGHEPELVAALAPQHPAAIFGEIRILLHRHAVSTLVLHAVDEHEDGHQRFDGRAERLVAREERDIQAQAVGQEGLRGAMNVCSLQQYKPNAPWSG
jgi:hypothetical protein